MRTACLILLTLITATCFAQEEVTFIVVKKKKVYIECKFDTLVGNTFYYFKAYGVSTKDIIPGKFAGGEVWLNDTAVCVHTSGNTSSAKKYSLELYWKKDTREIFSRNFTIIPQAQMPEFSPWARTAFKQPDIYIGGMYYQGNFKSSKDSIQQKVSDILSSVSPSSMSKSRITQKMKISFECNGLTDNYISDT